MVAEWKNLTRGFSCEVIFSFGQKPLSQILLLNVFASPVLCCCAEKMYMYISLK
jgi:hypothetical protein